MTTSDPLSASIKSILSQPKRQCTAEDIAQEAKEALAIIEANMHAISAASCGEWTERNYVVMQLLRASCDHGRALVYLFASNPTDMAGSAMVLHRSQIEQFVRGIFFGRDATDEELQYFLEEDEIPKRPTANGKMAKLHLNELAKIAHDRLGLDDTDKLASMIKNVWSPLNGLVHGGKALRVLYRDHKDEIGCRIPPAIQFQTIGNAMALTNFALIVAMEFVEHSPEDAHRLLSPSFDAIERYNEVKERRILEVGETV